ncbi:type I restriction endonuclease subunit R [Beggiatoa leptomitoformis]|uniref:Type I restriction enzyme endonuclease subunit n=1 Tax=Beggiatoa leptomitoformis TaxID=288004 RepID=A0A2N9YC78_9GAMM|nr:HsdR family type I site-specific deoxyribonuclease [Beggiatoa leptomitoformis]ALG66637.1 HsdR family type I site-specific deoxyribonuclease [Beggiatoa leptomitoformis]AUI68046.1 HsdR family type I site-specific deoxyribonuclease [Beggiatoa leptomitoformis]
MTTVDKPERATQNRVIKLFSEQLGYTYLGNLQSKPDNRNIEPPQLSKYLSANGYSQAHINKALDKLQTTANNHAQNLYNNNKAVYQLLRYGVAVKIAAGEPTDTVHIINWQHPEANDFYIAEEVTIYDGEKTKRPDIVLYINGIAIAVLELKNSRVSLGEGIRQSLNNQKSSVIGAFFSTIQFIFAGNDSEGLKYGTIGTPEKFFLNWKEDEQDNTDYKLDKYLRKICNKSRLIELIHDFILFDGNKKKLPRVHQYFGIKAAQKYIQRKQGGIIWHTQGSGKSIVMVLLAKWILENNPRARVVVITDRDELDKQIKQVFEEAGEKIHRSHSGRDLMKQLGQQTPRLLCSLVHKFGNKEVDNFEAFIEQLKSQPSPAVGELFVFVDECHRTQSGKLHRTMKALLPNAVFIGFTGTPLLKQDKATSLEVFGNYIHTYKFKEAVEDKVVLDLVYEARDIDQRLNSPQEIDAWFTAKTSGLNEYQQAALKKKWGTMQKVLSSESRLGKIVADIVSDFSSKARLSSESGNAILVASSIFDACHYYNLFQDTALTGKCALVTSYNPQNTDISDEETGANTETKKQFIYNTYTNLLKAIQAKSGKSKAETYENEVKQQFIHEPAKMKLLIVVDKLLTGFDAPSCSYLYIDKSMQDHGLFQAICRVNRLDTEDKLIGCIVDYKNLLENLTGAIQVYTKELDYDDFEAKDCDILLKNRLKEGRERLDNALEAIELICEPVPQPKNDLDYIHYFCGNTDIATDLKQREVLRMTLYQTTVSFIRAYANIADDMEGAGYRADEIKYITNRLNHYHKLREIIRKASGEVLDLKAYEADMQNLIDLYIQAEDSVVISPFANLPILEIIQKIGIEKAINTLPDGIKDNQDAAAETIENNVRSKIIKDQLLDPAYFEKMSLLLAEIILQRKQKAIDYQRYLQEMANLANQVSSGTMNNMPPLLNTQAKRALYNNLGQNEALALQIDTAILESKSDGWRGNQAKENGIKRAIYKILNDLKEVERIFAIIEQQRDY